MIQPDTGEVTVSIDVPINENSWVAPFFFKDMTVSTSMTMQPGTLRHDHRSVTAPTHPKDCNSRTATPISRGGVASGYWW